MENIWKDCEFVLLPTETKRESLEGFIVKCFKEHKVLKYGIGKLSFCVNTASGVKDHWEPQHLYVTSRDEIKVGDFYYLFAMSKQTIQRCETEKEAREAKDPKLTIAKVIASSDKRIGLGPFPHSGVSDISEEQIREYINLSGIKKIKVEYGYPFVKGNYSNECCVCGDMFHGTDKRGFICDKHNYPVVNEGKLSIKFKKDKVYTPEEVEELCKRAFDAGALSDINEVSGDWIKENL